MQNRIELYQTKDGKTQVEVSFENDTVWLNQDQLVKLFDRDQSVISRHINNIFKEGELNKKSNMQKMHIAKSDKPVGYYNLDVIISLGYRVKSIRGTRFRQWATQRLKDYLVEGYAINEQRLKQKQQEVKYLKTGIKIINRAIEEQALISDSDILKIFAKGLELLDEYDHDKLDKKGKSKKKASYPTKDDYLKIIHAMKNDYPADVFAQMKDESFDSSIHQIQQSFDGKDLYSSIEEKAAYLLYFIVKNHSFVDGNKRIAAACFLYFLEQNDHLFDKYNNSLINNDTIAAITLFVASSKSEEMETVVQLIISILNRGK